MANIDVIIGEAMRRAAKQRDEVDLSEQRMQQSVNLSRMAVEKLGYDPYNLTDEQAGHVLREVDGIIHYGEEESSYEKAAMKLVQSFGGKFEKKDLLNNHI